MKPPILSMNVERVKTQNVLGNSNEIFFNLLNIKFRNEKYTSHKNIRSDRTYFDVNLKFVEINGGISGNYLSFKLGKK